ncbi:MAG: hypothetical protein AAF412_02730 [Pseudomonadota bacterium]
MTSYRGHCWYERVVIAVNREAERFAATFHSFFPEKFDWLVLANNFDCKEPAVAINV